MNISFNIDLVRQLLRVFAKSCVKGQCDMQLPHFQLPLLHLASFPLAQGHFIQAECENFVSSPLDGLIRWESVERRTGENVDETRTDGVARYRPEHDVKMLTYGTFFVDSFLLD